ncbi:hypothetical protein ACWF99_01020 [Nocardia sp. NPDC055002]
MIIRARPVDHRVVIGDRCAEHDVAPGFEQMTLWGKTFHQVAGRQGRCAADVDDRPAQFEPAQRGVGAVERFGEHRVEIVVRGRANELAERRAGMNRARFPGIGGTTSKNTDRHMVCVTTVFIARWKVDSSRLLESSSAVDSL